MTGNELTGAIIDAAMHIHRTLGPGLLESVYSAILDYELKKRGLRVALEVPIPVQWDNLTIDVGFRADLIVEDEVIVELKSVEKIAAVHKKQLLTYLRVTNKQLGLLINYGEALLRDGITRIANNFDEKS